MTYEELGKKVKAKYPAYKNVSDDVLGQRVAEKYPEYQSQITQKGLVDKAVDVGKMLFPQTAKTIEQTVNLPQTYQKAYGLAKTDPKAAGEFAQGQQKQLLDQRNKTGLELAPYAVPFGKTLLASIPLGGIAGGVAAASRDNATPQDIAVGAGVGAGTAGVLKGAGSLVGGVIGKTGEIVKDTGEQLILKALRPSKSQITKFKRVTGMDLADWLNKKHITSNFAQEAEKRIDDLQTQFDDLAVNSGVKVNKDVLMKSFSSRIDEMQSSVVPTIQGKADELKKVFENIIGKHGDKIDVQQLTQERRAIDALLKESQFGMPTEQASYLRSARDAIQETIQNSTKGLGPKDLKTIGMELRELFEFQKIAANQQNLGRGANVLGLLQQLGGISGGVVGGLPGAVGGVLATTALKNPRVVSAGSRMLRSAGSQIERLPAVGNRMEPLMRALRNVTASQVSQQRLP